MRIPGGLLKLLVLGTLVLIGSLSLAVEAAQYSALKIKPSGGLKCIVCTSLIHGGCDGTKKHLIKTYKGECDETYVEKVYGASAKKGELEEWPPATDNEGWQLSGDKGGKKSGSTRTASASGAKGVKVSTIADSEANFTNGYQTCMFMRVYADEQKNGGRSYSIASDKPRVVRGCSFYDMKTVKEHEKLGDDGCKTITMKTATVTVCYCDKEHCNGASYLRASQSWILLASLLVMAAKIGLTMYA